MLHWFQESTTLKASYENQLRRLESDNRAAVAALEQQLSLQQQRSLATLSERDAEIQRLAEELHKQEKAPPQVCWQWFIYIFFDTD